MEQYDAGEGLLAAEIRKLKQAPDADMTILGSGSIVTQLVQAELIDEFQVVVNPVVLGAGRTMFDGVKQQLNLKLTKSRTFGRRAHACAAALVVGDRDLKAGQLHLECCQL